MRVKLSKNGEEITSIDFRATEPFAPESNVDEAFRCLNFRFRLDRIPNVETVIEAFRNQNPRGGCCEYRAEVNGDIWRIDVIHYFCSDCGVIQTEVDNEGDLCGDCRRRQSQR